MYKPEQIERAFSALLNADVEIKTTSIDTIFIIQKMLIKIINGEYPKNTIDY
jgi:DNA polymerase III delta subunit